MTPKSLRKMICEGWPVNEWRKPIGKIDKVYSVPDGEIGKLKFGADIVIEGHGLKLKDVDGIHLFVTYKRDPFGLDKGALCWAPRSFDRQAHGRADGRCARNQCSDSAACL